MACLQIIGQEVNDIIPLLLVFIGIVYLITLLKIYFGWRKLPEIHPQPISNLISVSVIIAARNEKETLPLLLEKLSQQNYPGNKFEIIVVDDHSDDPIDKLPEISSNKSSNLRTVRLDKELSGKKMALLTGAKTSMGELLLFTDADCLPGPSWISSFVSFYRKTESDMILGLVDYLPSRNPLTPFYRLEFLSLILSGAGTAGNGRPTLCNGANLAVRRELYLQIADQLKPEQPSGDDIFLLHALKRKDQVKISVLKNQDSIIKTLPPESLLQFLNQRVRWASKSLHYTDLSTIYLGSIVLITNLSIIFSVIAFLAGKSDGGLIFILLLMKTIADYPLLIAGLNFFQRKRILLLVPLFETFYPFYILLSSIGGLLNLYSWKNRIHKSQSSIQ